MLLFKDCLRFKLAVYWCNRTMWNCAGSTSLNMVCYSVSSSRSGEGFVVDSGMDFCFG